MILLDWRYKFTFKSPLEKHNGLYRVTKILGFTGLIDEGIDIFKELFEEEKLMTEVQYESNVVPLLRVEPIYTLTALQDESVILHMPLSYIALEPDPNIKEYYETVVSWYVGPFKDKTQLSVVTDNIRQYIEKTIGTPTDPQLFDIGTKWLSDTEYQAIENERMDRREIPFTWYTEWLKLQKDNLYLRDRVTALENALIEQQGSI